MFNFLYIIFKIFVICNTNHQNVHKCSENLIYVSQCLDYCISHIYTTGYEKIKRNWNICNYTFVDYISKQSTENVASTLKSVSSNYKLVLSYQAGMNSHVPWCTYISKLLLPVHKEICEIWWKKDRKSPLCYFLPITDIPPLGLSLFQFQTKDNSALSNKKEHCTLILPIL